MNLTETPQTVEWPETDYIFIEKVGPFMQNAPAAWTEVHKLIPAVAERNQITGYMSLYEVGPRIYRAGVAVAAAPSNLPEGLQYEKFSGGKYCKFVLTGSYASLPQACGRVAELAQELKLPVRDGFNIENYVNDPRTTPEDQLITEILFPTA
jgi:effector-binding domain-containing protein